MRSILVLLVVVGLLFVFLGVLPLELWILIVLGGGLAWAYISAAVKRLRGGMPFWRRMDMLEHMVAEHVGQIDAEIMGEDYLRLWLDISARYESGYETNHTARQRSAPS